MNITAKLRALGVGEAAIARWTASGGPSSTEAPATNARPYAPYRSKLELQYSKYLTLRKAAGEINGWRYEAVPLQLGGGAGYLCDFEVTMADGSLEMHEVKGYAREAAIVRLKVAADKYRDRRFILVTYKRARWRYRIMSPYQAVTLEYDVLGNLTNVHPGA